MERAVDTLYSFLSRCGACLVVVAWSCCWSAVTLPFDAKVIHTACKQIQALTFDTVEGTIIDSRIIENQSEVVTYEATVQFRYRANGREFTGNQYRHWLSPGDHRHAERMAAGHPTGGKTTVYYNPANPAEALLAPGLAAQDFFALLCTTPFNIVVLGSWALAARLLRRRRGIVPADLQICDNGEQLRARPPRTNAIGAAALVALIVSTLSIVAVAFTAGAPPSSVAVAIAWTCVIATALYVYRAAHPKWEELRIDRVRGMLALSGDLRGRSPVLIPLTRIVDISVGEHPIPTSDNKDQRSYSCRVRWATTEGATTEAAWLNQSDQQCAEQLVAWLREACFPR
ncbi:MAG TPA: DUF3592 domain-containing protein [Pirellulales bacterium]